MKINMQKWAENIIASKDVKNLPVLFFPVLKNMGMGVIESVQDPANMAKAMKEVIDEYPETLAAITGMDLTADPEAFGATVKFSKRQAPAVKGSVIRTAEDIDALTLPDCHAGRLDLFYEAIEKASEVITDRPIMGGMFGPFSLAAALLEVSNALIMSGRNPEAMEKLLEISTEFLINRAKEYKARGANGVFIAEPTAGILSPEGIDRFSSKYIRKMVDAVQDEKFFLILHDCADVVKSVKSMYNTGCKGFHFGNDVDMKEILPQIPADVLVFGNVDPSSAFFLETPEYVYDKTMELLKDMEQYPHFVLSSGCDLAPAVSNENLEAYYKACRDFNKANGAETKISLEGFLA